VPKLGAAGLAIKYYPDARKKLLAQGRPRKAERHHTGLR
jgi:hypothetical protein